MFDKKYLHLLWVIPLSITITIWAIYLAIGATKGLDQIQNNLHITNKCESLKDYCQVIQCKLDNKEVYSDEYVSSLIIINNNECLKNNNGD